MSAYLSLLDVIQSLIVLSVLKNGRLNLGVSTDGTKVRAWVSGTQTDGKQKHDNAPLLDPKTGKRLVSEQLLISWRLEEAVSKACVELTNLIREAYGDII